MNLRCLEKANAQAEKLKSTLAEYKYKKKLNIF